MKTIKNIWNFLREQGKFIALQTLICGFIITIVIITMTALFTGCGKTSGHIDMGEVYFGSKSTGCAVERRSPSGEHDIKYIGCNRMSGCDSPGGREFMMWAKTGEAFEDLTLLSPYNISGYLCEDPLPNTDYYICYDGSEFADYGEATLIIRFMN
tara:strand:+ start:2395 stop:2859 length:465 start_codon:yes stop_codon:yes gene_type:complete